MEKKVNMRRHVGRGLADGHRVRRPSRFIDLSPHDGGSCLVPSLKDRRGLELFLAELSSSSRLDLRASAGTDAGNCSDKVVPM